MEYSDLARLVCNKERVDKSILFTPQNSAADLLFESIKMPHWSYFVTLQDIQTLYETATSKVLAGNFDKRKQIMDSVMANRGFKFMAGGTNRSVYRHLEFPQFVAKVAIDKVGLGDNMAEYKNQLKIWPYCAKMIQVCPTGVLGFAERLKPILNRYEFNAYALQIYTTTIQIIGKYVLEDIGEMYFKNWAVRENWGACLCDYPYIFELDGRKLICQQLLGNGMTCGGEIDYDDGFNHLHCKRCGRKYDAAELQMSLQTAQIGFSTISKGGKKPMSVTFSKGSKVITSSNSSDSIVKPETKIVHEKPKVVYTTGHASFSKGGKALISNQEVVTKPYRITTSATFNIPSSEEIEKPAVKEAEPVIPMSMRAPEVKIPEEEKEEPKKEDGESHSFLQNNERDDKGEFGRFEVEQQDAEAAAAKLAEETEALLGKSIAEIEEGLPANNMVEIEPETEISAPVTNETEIEVESIPETPYAPESTETEASGTEETKEEPSEPLNIPEENQDIVNRYFETPNMKEEFPKSPWSEPIQIKKGKHIISEVGKANEEIQFRQKNPYLKS